MTDELQSIGDLLFDLPAVRRAKKVNTCPLAAPLARVAPTYQM
jgi:hypothetical protein